MRQSAKQVNDFDLDGRTALHWAAATNNTGWGTIACAVDLPFTRAR